MAGSRIPGPVGSGQSGSETPDDFRPPARGFSPGPVGDEVPLQAGSGKPPPKPSPPQPPPQPAQAVELNILADFPTPAEWRANPKTEKDLAAASTWFPSTADFQAVAGKNATTVNTAFGLLLAIFNSPSPIKRLNFFSHGKTGLISFEGTIDPKGTSVSFANGSDKAFGQIFGKVDAIADPYAGIWGTKGENSSTKITLDKTTLSLDDIRAKFTKDAVIFLYLCNGGSDPLLQQQVANAFKVTVKAFSSQTLFFVPNNFPQNRKHDVGIKGTNDKFSDFHQLDNNSKITSLPPK